MKKHEPPAFAIFKQGSKQYRVQEGDIIHVDLMEAEVGSDLVIKEVLFVGDEQKPLVGNPLVSHYQIQCKVLGTEKGPKLSFVKYKPSHNQRKAMGHRQDYTTLKIEKIGKAEGRHHHGT
jgi:large subunit ribosomal protein L21